MDVTQILLNAQNPDPNVRIQAEKQLEDARDANFPVFMETMVNVLAAEDQPAIQVRMLAALQMKNAISAKSEEKNMGLQDRWKNTEVKTRSHVKAGCLQSLISPQEKVRQQAAQVISKIALCELPDATWPEVIPQLKHHVTAAADPNAKHGSLIALGYICQDISEADSDCLKPQANDILTAVIQGMRKEEVDINIKLAATTALNNAIEFVSDNFENEQERNFIMQQVCEATQCPDARVQKEALSCLVEIAYYYYSKLPAYIAAIKDITVKAIQGADQEIATSAMEFWSTLVEEELGLLEQIADGECEAAECHKIIEQASPMFLVQLLLDCLLRQEEDEDEDSWTISMAAHICLGFVCQCAKDVVVDIVMRFVNSNVQHANWIYQDAATSAFGCLMDGPSEEKLRGYMADAIMFFIGQVANPAAKPQVRVTTAWALAKILEQCPGTIPPACVNDLMTNLVGTLKSEPRVAIQGCAAINNFALFVEDSLVEESPPTTELTRFTQVFLQSLVQAGNREDADEVNTDGFDLFSNCYETMSTIVKVSGQDVFPVLVQLTPAVVGKLKQTFAVDVSTKSAAEAVFLSNVQSHCCAVISELCTKLPKESVVGCADEMMEGLLAVLNVTRNAEALDEALMAIGALCTNMEAGFAKYMEHLKGFLNGALENSEDHQVCAAAVNLVGNLASSLEASFSPYCDDIMLRLMQNLMKQALHRSVKPPILSTFGDIALAINADFVRFLEHSMTMLYNASQIELNTDDYDDADYLNQLRENILDGYSGITHALRDADKKSGAVPGQGIHVQKLKPYLPNVVFLLEQKIAPPQENKSPRVLRAAINLIGDIAMALPDTKPHFNTPWVISLIQEAATYPENNEYVQQAQKNLS